MGQGIFGNRKQFGNTLGSKKVQKTKNSKSDIIKSINKGKTNKLPEKESQTAHIFRGGEGHYSWSKKNALTLSNLINDDNNLVLENDKYGNSWYARIDSNGKQIWGSVHNNVLSEGGINDIPRIVDSDTGLNKNPFKK